MLRNQDGFQTKRAVIETGGNLTFYVQKIRHNCDRSIAESFTVDTQSLCGQWYRVGRKVGWCKWVSSETHHVSVPRRPVDDRSRLLSLVNSNPLAWIWTFLSCHFMLPWYTSCRLGKKLRQERDRIGYCRRKGQLKPVFRIRAFNQGFKGALLSPWLHGLAIFYFPDTNYGKHV